MNVGKENVSKANLELALEIRDQCLTCIGQWSCYPLICTIVGLPEESPVDRHVQCLILVYQLIHLHV